MTAAKRLQSLAQARLDQGAWHKLRQAFPDWLSVLRALPVRRSAEARITTSSKFVVVGLGIAARTCIKALHAAGFTDVTVIARDTAFGGKCVNFGCMPSEFVLTRDDLPLDERRSELATFIEALRADTEREFRGLGFTIIEGEVESINGRHIRLRDGTTVEFDQLVLATGSELASPRVPVDTSKRISIEEVWSLPVGSRLAIWADNNVTGLALGSVARALGLDATVLLSGANPFADLPAFRYFLRQTTGAGLKVFPHARLLRVDASSIDFEAGRKIERLAYDHLLTIGSPSPRLVPIDGAMPSVFDLDLTRASLPRRSDIAFLGDCGGYFTATEAEAQVKLLVRAWVDGGTVDLRALAELPTIIDGPTPLAILGQPWTYYAKDWREVDFRGLGWSKIGGLEGKLWYLLDPETGRLDGLQICHRDAKALSALARLLMERPVTDPSWFLCAPHPAAAEIFKLLAEQAGAELARTEAASQTGPATFRLPPLDDLTPAGPLPDWLSRPSATAALTSSSPHRDLALHYAVSIFAGLSGRPAEQVLAAVTGLNAGGPQLSDDKRERIVILEGNGHAVRVSY